MIENNAFVHGGKKQQIKYQEAHDLFYEIDPKIQNLFLKCLDEGSSKPEKRPSLDEWENVLNEVIKEEKKIVNPIQIILNIRKERQVAYINWRIEDSINRTLNVYYESYLGGYTKMYEHNIKEKDKLKIPLVNSKYEIIAYNGKKIVYKTEELSI